MQEVKAWVGYETMGQTMHCSGPYARNQVQIAIGKGIGIATAYSLPKDESH